MKLYKYIPLNNTDYVKKSMFIMSPTDKFNDPFEGIHFANNLFHCYTNNGEKIITGEFKAQIELTLKAFNKKHNIPKHNPDKIDSFEMKCFLNDLRVACLSKKYNDCLMWSYYGASHTGICLEYSSDILESSIPNVEPAIEVEYSDSIPTYDIDSINKNKTILLKRKNIIWRHEEEIRYVTNKDSLLCTNNIYYVKIKPQTIFLGVKISDENKKSIYDFAIKENIDIKELTISKTDYSLIIK